MMLWMINKSLRFLGNTNLQAIYVKLSCQSEHSILGYSNLNGATFPILRTVKKKRISGIDKTLLLIRKPVQA